MANGFIWL